MPRFRNARPRRPAIALLCLTGMLLLATAASAGEMKRVRLRDGSAIVAEVQGLTDGVYTLRSPDIGTLHLSQDRVEAVEPLEAAPAPDARADEVRALQTQLLTDPGLVQKLLELQSSPAMQQVLEDPEILRLAAKGDLAALEKNPKMQRLMQDPTVREVLSRMQPAPPEKPAP